MDYLMPVQDLIFDKLEVLFLKFLCKEIFEIM